MKTILNYALLLGISILLFGCTTDSYSEISISDASIRREAETFGKQIADNLRHVVTQMNENGDDFNNLAKVKTAIVKYLPQQTNDTPISVDELDRTLQGKRFLTPVQMTFLEKINEAQTKSRTVDEFLLHLKEIIKEIQATVPEIQQRNLLKMTVALCHLVKEMDSLLKEGLMPINLKQPLSIRLRSGSEDDDDNNKNSFWSAMVAGLCVSVSDIGSVLLAALEEVAVAAGSCILVVAGCLLLTGDTENTGVVYCNKMYEKCTETPLGNPGTGGPGSTMCGKCLEFCLAQGYWDCPRPH